MLFIPILFFFLFIILFLQLKQNTNFKESGEELKISILVAAKNEEKNLENLINSLANQNYSKLNYEVIIIDDNSTDSTHQAATDLISLNDNFRIIKADSKRYEGKRGALQIGIEASQFEYILITDADCVAEKDFIKTFSNKFRDNFDFIFGVAPFKQTKSVINKIACFDNLWVHILTFSLASKGLPYSAAARSLGFNKKSFSKIGGYKNTTDTLSGDDDLLLREAVKNKLKIGTIINPKSFVYTKSKENFGSYIAQKSRHTSTSNYYSLYIKIVLGLWHGLNLFMMLSLFFAFINFDFTYLFLVKIFGDIFLVKQLMKTFSYKFSFSEIIWLQIFYEILLVVNYVRGSFFKVKWQ